MAPVLNHYIYNGEAVIKPDDMVLIDGEYSGLEIKGQYVEISRLRDVFYDIKVKRSNGVYEHFRVGFENRSTDSKELVIKNNTYNVMDIERQRSQGVKVGNYTPMVTFTFNHGSTPLKGPFEIKEIYSIPSESPVNAFIDSARQNTIDPHVEEDEVLYSLGVFGYICLWIKHQNDKMRLEELANDPRTGCLPVVAATAVRDFLGINMEIKKEEEKVVMCRGIDELVADKADVLAKKIAPVMAREMAESIAESIAESMATSMAYDANVNTIKSVMSNLSVSAEKAMDIMSIEEDKRAIYRERLISLAQ